MRFREMVGVAVGVWVLCFASLVTAADPVPIPAPPAAVGPIVKLVPKKERSKLDEYPTTVGVPVEITTEGDGKDIRWELATESPNCYYTVSGGVCTVVANSPGRYIVACFGPSGPATLRVVNVGGVAPFIPPVVPPVNPPDVLPADALVQKLQATYTAAKDANKDELLKDLIQVCKQTQIVAAQFNETKNADGSTTKVYTVNTVDELAAKFLNTTKDLLGDLKVFVGVRTVLAEEMKLIFPKKGVLLTDTLRTDAVKKFATIQAALEKVK